MKKSLSTALTAANMAEVLTLLAEIPQRLERLSQQLSPAQWQQPLGAGERSFTETLAHLVNCEARTAEAIYLALLVPKPTLADVHPERQWGKLRRYDLLAPQELSAYFKTRRTLLLHTLTPLTPEQWACVTRTTTKKRAESVYWHARALALHELEHLSALESKLAKELANA